MNDYDLLRHLHVARERVAALKRRVEEIKAEFPEFAELENAQTELAAAEQQAREHYLVRYHEANERSWYGGKVSVRMRRKVQLSPEEERQAVEWAMQHGHPELLAPSKRYEEALLNGGIDGMPGSVLEVPTVYLPSDLNKILEGEGNG
jgi:DNA repair exonuclease SbcCD ATPase subunit